MKQKKKGKRKEKNKNCGNLNVKNLGGRFIQFAVIGKISQKFIEL